ncbi:hypothetical protein H2200_000441 [Cladophialophora chaetospira]|uniref:Beta-lactamase-related domain-containing protein n=1 Tax=Cladophialophora chaetospira TaxID=386627 RepID=A0AA39CQC0_9EURO|nr:hypothetical protein H2200_000441 [Cladophialophora chaetospira]
MPDISQTSKTSPTAFFSLLDDLIASQFPNATPSSALQQLGTPSISIAVLTASEILTHTISSPSSPANTDTLYQACSISKPICGLAVLRTIDQGKLSHDDAVTKHLPAEYIDAISTPKPRRLLDHLTIAHLISHTGGTAVSGFPGYDCNGAFPSLTTVLQGSVGSNTPQIRISRLPGLKWRYSGGGTTILQAILESIHKKPLPEIVRELVFEPLGMTRSFYKDTLSNGEANFAKCFATGVTETSPARWHVQPELGAAGVWTTPADLLKAQRGIRDAALGKNDFSSRELARKGITAVDGADGYTYGGWMSGTNWFGHGGSNNPGYRCRTLLCFDHDGTGQLGKAEGEGIAVMTNSALGQDVYLKVIQAVAYLRGWPGRDVLGLHEIGNAVIPLSLSNHQIDADWEDWEGRWEVFGGKDQTDEKDVRRGQVLEIAELQGKPCLKLDYLPYMQLVQAAMPPVRYEKEAKQGIDLVVDGLDMMVSLGYNDAGECELQIWPGLFEEPLECCAVE